MNCHQVQSKIAQIEGDAPPAEIVAHARECAACRQTLREVLWQQKWLKERFAAVSEHLIAHAPPLWAPSFQERLREPAFPALFSPLAWATVLVGAAVLGWWAWTGSPTSSSKSAVAEQRATREFAERTTPDGANHRANSELGSPELESLGSVPGSSWPSETGPMWTLPERKALSQPSRGSVISKSSTDPDISQSSAESAAAESSPEVAASEPSPAPKFRLGTGVFKMQPTALAPGAKGYLAAIIPKDATDQATAVVALSVTGLPTQSVFYVRTKDVGGNQVSLGSGRTDINGSAVAVMLRGSPTTAAAGTPTLSVNSTEPPVTLNFDGATGEDLAVVDTAGNVLMTVGAATASTVGNKVNPSPTP